MGYRHKIPHINVSFEDGHEYHGCEAVLRTLKLGEWLEITGMGVGEASVVHVGDQLKRMADKLVSWNLEDEDGTPVPVTAEAVLDQDQALMIAILNGWLDGLNKSSDVPAPLEQNSPDGVPSLEVSLPMEPLSPSLAS